MASEPVGMKLSHQRGGRKSLAYEHMITVKVSEALLEQQYRQTIKKCAEYAIYHCTVLGTRLETGERKVAQIRLRISPQGLEKMIRTALSGGRLGKRSTRVSDLAKPIKDNGKRRLMLKRHRDQLLKLQKRSDHTVESLIKLSAELSRVQSDLEHTEGQYTHLMKRIQLDLVQIYFEVEHQNSFLSPIVKAIKSFTAVFAKGVSNMIWTIGFFLPWGLFLGIVGAVGWMGVRKRKRK